MFSDFMSVSPSLLKILCCPETRQDVRLAEPTILTRLNARITKQTLINRAGQIVEDQIEDGLLRADGTVLYPVRRGVPVMLSDAAIAMSD